MAKLIQCSIIITEVDGKLHIIGKIPDGAEKTIACVLTEALLVQAETVMNGIMGDNKKFEELSSH